MFGGVSAPFIHRPVGLGLNSSLVLCVRLSSRPS